MVKQLIGAVAIALTFALFFPYIRSTQRGETRPHAFSWVIWGFGTLTVFFAQHAGRCWRVGDWRVWSGLVLYRTTRLSQARRYRHHRDGLGVSWSGVVLSAMLIFTADPLWAVVTLTLVDIIGFGPTIRKAYARPYEESVGFFALSALRNLLVILALEHYSFTTVLFPAAVGVACLLIAILLSHRKRGVTAPHHLTAK